MPQTLTLAEARKRLWNYASKADYDTSTAAEKLLVDNAINEVQERFITAGKWRGAIVRADFVVYDTFQNGNLLYRQFTLPAGLGSAIKIAPLDAEGNACGNYMPHNHWYSIYGTSSPDAVGYCEPHDLGEGYTTFRDYDGIFYIKAVCELAEADRSLLLRGLDDAGKVIYSGASTEGVSLTLSGTTTTAQEFSQIDYWVKRATTTGLPAATNGPVRLYAVDVTDATERLIAIIPPVKTVSNYRRYAVPWDVTQVRAICKRTFVPAVSDADPIIPGNIGAMKLGLKALTCETNDDDSDEKYWANAFGILNADRDEFDGDHLPTLQVDSAFGMGGMPAFDCGAYWPAYP